MVSRLSGITAVSSAAQSRNTYLPRLLTLFRTGVFCNAEQPENALSPMDSISGESLTVSSEVQPVNAELPSAFVPSAVTVFRAVQPLNASSGSAVSDLENATDSRAVLPANTDALNAVMPSPHVTVFSEEHPENRLFPMALMLSGSVSVSSAEQP